jgi:hypothetical protein
MTSVSPKLVRIRTRFERVRSAQESFVLSLPNMHRRQGNKSVPMGRTQRERLCEMSFVILFTAWEQFLESAFEMYVVDAPLASFKSRHRVLVVDLDTVHGLIRGGRRYAEWHDSASVRDRAKVFFKNGEPFESALSAVSDDLTKMRIIRNRCVHFSQHSDEQYQRMIRKVFGSSQQLPPGKLLLNRPPKALSSASGANTYATVFQLYGEILSTASLQIIPERRK